VKSRQQELSFEIGRDDGGNSLNRVHRRKFLFSGLLRCGCCGGEYTILAQDRYGCATRRSKGTCNNNATISRQEIESRVLEGLKDRLMAPELVREFVRAFQEEANRAAKGQDQQLKADRIQLQQVERKIAGIVTAIEEGRFSRVLGDRLSELEHQQEQLRLRVSEIPTSVRLHPRLADIYADKVRKLELSLNDPAIRGEAARVVSSQRGQWRRRRAPRRSGRDIEFLRPT
jgi:hypothetical protein